MTKYGRQPFMDILVERNIPYNRAAEDAGVFYHHLRNVGYGYCSPKYDFRDKLQAYFNMPLDQLLTREAIESDPWYVKVGRPKMNKIRKAKRDV